MTVLVLGGAGFLGSHLVERLLLDARSVVVVDDLSSGRLANLAEARKSGGDLKIHQHRLGSPGTAELVEKARPSVIYHLARPALDDAGPLSDLGSTLDVLEAAVGAGVERVVVGLDAGRLYAPSPDRRRLAESEALESRVAGIGDRAVLDALAAYRSERSIEYMALAIASVYGPRMRPGSGRSADLVDQVLSSAARDEACVLRARSLHHDLVFVDDVVDALARAGTRGSGLLVNVGSGQAVTAEQVALAATGAGASATFAAQSREASQQLVLDVNRARIHLGWQPFTELGDGMQITLAWLGKRSPS